MTTSFPTGLDTPTNPTGADTLASVPHAGQHADVNDAIEALEAEVGIRGSAVATSHAYKLDHHTLEDSHADVDGSVVPTVGNALMFQQNSEEDVDGFWTPAQPVTDHGLLSGNNDPADHPWAALAAHGHTLEELLGFLRVYKTADETVTASTTLQNDDHLFFDVAANEIFFFEAYLRMNASAAAMDCKFGWSAPAGATMDWGVEGQGSNFTRGFMTTGTTQTPTGFLAVGDTASFGVPATAINFGIAFKGWVYNSATPGQVRLRWAQDTSDAGNLKVLQHSFIRCWRQEG